MMLEPDRRTLLLAGSLAGMAGAASCRHGASARRALPMTNLLMTQAAQAIVDSIAVTSFPRASTPITAYGAEEGADGANVVEAINAAISAVSAAGGGRVIVPPGLWLSDGPVHLKSNVDLHLQKGAILRFLPNPDRYLPPVLTRWEGTEAYSYSPFVYALEQENIAVTGEGVLDGQGEAHWLAWRRDQEPVKSVLRDMGRDGVEVRDRVFIGERRLRPHFVQFFRCKRVLVDGPEFRDSPFWMIHPVYCSDVIVRNVRCISRHINSDGVDPDSSTRVLIENCDFDVGDDGVAIKAGRDQDGWRVGIACTKIVIRNCRYLGNTGGAVAIGSEMSGGVSDVFIENWTIPDANHALYFKANLDRGGAIENVFIRNIRAGKVEALVLMTNDYHSYRGGEYPPRFQNISIEDVRCVEARYGISIKGHPDAPVSNVQIRDVVIGRASEPLELTDTSRIELQQVFANGREIGLEDAVAVSSGKKS